MNSLFCRHNRFTADCPICSKGTVLSPDRGPRQRRRASESGGAKRAPKGGGMAPRFTGPYVGAGPYEYEDGQSYEVRLERVPGGMRLAEWSAGQLARRAPVLRAGDIERLIREGGERAVLREADADKLADALTAGAEAPEPEPDAFGSSPGRAGDMQEDLRVERAGAGMVRIGRWVLRPGSGWELQEAPVMLPAARYAEALRDAAARGVLGPVSGAGDAARP